MNSLKNNLKKAFLIIGILLLAASCGKNEDGKAAKGVFLLNEAEFLIQSREFTPAEAKILNALEVLNAVIKNTPENVDYRLYRSRAHILLFESQNILTIERAPERPRSLVKIPDAWEYVDYDKTIALAEEDLRYILNLQENITPKQEASARAMMGNIYRLDIGKALEADEYYQKAISATRNWLGELETSKTRLDPHTYDIQRANRQIDDLQVARIEVLLLAEKWATALSLLEEMMAGQDFKYFSVQYTLLENKIASLFDRIEERKEHNKETRAGKLKKFLDESRSKKRKDDDGGLSSFTPIELEIMKTEEILAATKNNLIYRTICYHNLGMQEELSIAHGILFSFYPDIDAQLTLSLHQSSHTK
ncbi:MAG: hypothetical protein ACI8RA_001918 [Chlamydiales bacterium]|jgi:hypothetical protein